MNYKKSILVSVFMLIGLVMLKSIQANPRRLLATFFAAQSMRRVTPSTAARLATSAGVGVRYDSTSDKHVWFCPYVSLYVQPSELYVPSSYQEVKRILEKPSSDEKMYAECRALFELRSSRNTRWTCCPSLHKKCQYVTDNVQPAKFKVISDGGISTLDCPYQE